MKLPDFFDKVKTKENATQNHHSPLNSEAPAKYEHIKTMKRF